MRATLYNRLIVGLTYSENGCWTWFKALNPEGYGLIADQGVSRRVHAVSYELHVGPVPKGLVIDHLCRNRACANPETLPRMRPRLQTSVDAKQESRGPSMNERHEKWTPVSPGTVIPAGQPYRVEFNDGRAHERVAQSEWSVGNYEISDVFIDSSWKPPLVLPTEPTWGFAVRAGTYEFMRWWRKGKKLCGTRGVVIAEYPAEDVLDFIPLTDAQVERIEAAR